jgi:hypothetical protein
MKLKYKKGDIFKNLSTGEMFEITKGRLNCGFPFYYGKDLAIYWKSVIRYKVDEHNLDDKSIYKKLSKTAKILYGAKSV